jgi:ribosomal protein S6--L-glutamate ligase
VADRSGCVVTLVSGLGWHVEDLRRAATGLSLKLIAVPFEALEARVGARSGTRAGEHRLDEAGAVLVRMMPPGSLEQVVFRMDALHRLEGQGVPIVNPPRAVETAVDKYLTLVRLESAGLRVPRTWTGETAEGALAAFDELGGDVVLKPLFGSEGRGLVRVTDRETAWRVAHALERVGAVLYVQAFLPHDGHDTRLFVIGERVIGAMRRHAAAPDWRTNVAQGGRSEAVAIDVELAELALRSAHAVGAEVAGIDILRDPEGRPHVVEVNAVPGWKALSQATGIDVARAILEHVRGRFRC